MKKDWREKQQYFKIWKRLCKINQSGVVTEKIVEPELCNVGKAKGRKIFRNRGVDRRIKCS